MTTALLFEDQNIIEFLQAQIGLTGQSPWLFVHVPETATYLVRDVLADILQPEHVVTAPTEAGKVDYDTAMSRHLQKFEQTEELGKCRFVSGHFKVFQLDASPAFAKGRLATILRDPVDRLLSDFLAQSGGRGRQPSAQQFVEFAKNPSNQNVYLQFLCPRNMWKPSECVEFIQKRFDFIGIAEDLPMTIKMFYAIHGARHRGPTPSQEEKPSKLTRADLSPDLIRTVSQLNAVDYHIFRHFHDRFVSLKESFYEMSDFGRIFTKLSYR
jgi:Sulfotransferase family